MSKVCPVCDAPIEDNVKRCNSCGTDLSLFDLDKDIPTIELEEGKTLENLLGSIEEGKVEEIVEEIKTIGKSKDPGKSIEAREEEAKFICPSCNAEVSPDAISCPKCGAEFGEVAIEQFECPLCSALVDASATVCPKCGAEFENEVEELGEEGLVEEKTEEVLMDEEKITKPLEKEKEEIKEEMDEENLYKQLPVVVGEIKPLLLIAKNSGIRISRSKELIDNAISAGRKKNIKKAIRLVKEGKKEVEKSLHKHISDEIALIRSEIEGAKKMGADLRSIYDLTKTCESSLREKKYAEAVKQIYDAKRGFDELFGDYRKAKNMLDGTEELIKDAEILNLDLSEVKELYDEGRDALRKKEWEKALSLAEKNREQFIKVLLPRLSDEIKKARALLVEAKTEMKDITKLVRIILVL
jgi:ribosomal protein L40E